MSTEVLVGLIGLGGALVGAAAAFSGVVYQQRHQAKLARQQRLDAIAEATVDTLITELEKLHSVAKRDLAEVDLDTGHEQWWQEVGEHIDRIRLAALRLPHQELREGIEAACAMGFGGHSVTQRLTRLPANKITLMAACVEAQRCLGAYLRREPIPAMHVLGQMRSGFQAALAVLPEGYPPATR